MDRRKQIPLFAGLEPVVTTDGAAVGDALTAIDTHWPGLLGRLCEPGPRLRRHIRVFVDRAPAELATPVRVGERVDVLTAIAGG